MNNATSSDNPYRSPRVTAMPPASPYVLKRRQALWEVRLALIALMIPALLNFVCFFFVEAPQRFVHGTFFLFGTLFLLVIVVDTFLLVVLNLFVWFFGLWTLERIAIVLHWFTRCSREEWLGCLHQSIIERLSIAARIGALIWLAWLGLFYFTPAPVIIIHNVASIFAWGVAAWVVLPLLLKWWRLRDSGIHTPNADLKSQ